MANTKTVVTKATPGAIWQIKGTHAYGLTKEELKPLRRELNAEAGVYEVETKTSNGQIHNATPSHKWPFTIAMTDAHPRSA